MGFDLVFGVARENDDGVWVMRFNALNERRDKVDQVLSMRQPDLTVLAEKLHKPRNLSAIIRTCDAVGINEVHAVPGDDGGPRAQGQRPGQDGAGECVVNAQQRVVAPGDLRAGRDVGDGDLGRCAQRPGTWIPIARGGPAGADAPL